MVDEARGAYPVCRGDRDNVIDARPAHLRITAANRLGWRLSGKDKVTGATVELREGNGEDAVTIASGVTNESGFVDLTIAPEHVHGEYTLSIQPEHSWPWDKDVGPALVGGASPARVWRPHEERIRLECGVVEPPPPVLARGYCTNSTNRPPVGLHLDPNHVVGRGHEYALLLQPAWIHATGKNARTREISLILIHHTGANPNSSGAIRELLGERASTHYVVDIDGQIIKLVNENERAFHAGRSWWEQSDVNAFSVGIDMAEVNVLDDTPVGDRAPFTAAQYDALIRLIGQLREAYPTISEHRIVGHGDVALIPAGTRLGNKFECPGAHFQWELLNAGGLGVIPRSEQPDLAQAYRGYFALHTEPLQKDDEDRRPRLGGARRDPSLAGAIRELQTDLADIGYYLSANGTFDGATKAAVAAFNIHFRSMYEGRAARRTVDSKELVDAETARLIKRVRPT